MMFYDNIKVIVNYLNSVNIELEYLLNSKA